MARRNLYLTNTPAEEALALFMRSFTLTAAREIIDTADALGRVAAEAVYAACNAPLYDSAAMDGIAVCSARTRGAGETRPLTLTRGEEYIPADTGDPLRPPFDAVVMAEDIQETGDDTVVIRAAAAPWQHVRPVGEDIAQGEMILPGGSVIRPVDVGMLRCGGVARMAVYKKARVAILPTGTELVQPGVSYRDGDIIESNSHMLAGLVAEHGGEACILPPVPDDYAIIRDTIADAVRAHDLILVLAGSSAGTEDYTVHTLRELGEVIVHGVAVKPGKPVILAVVQDKPVIGIPGYPVSAYIAYQHFAAPVLAGLTSRLPDAAVTCKATISRRIISSLKYKEYVRVTVGRVNGRLVATPLSRGAGAAMSLVRADGFCVIDRQLEGIEAGGEADILLTRALSQVENTLVCTGSHDLILDIAADLLPRHLPGTRLSCANVGSLGGLLAVKNGEAHIAPTHLLDEETGQYNLPYLHRIFGAATMALIKGVGRTQGILVQKGNPLHIEGISDLPHARYVNRQRGAGTRVLLDYLLKQADISVESIEGYTREAANHMAVAAAIKNNGADAGMGIYSAARAMSLDFIPVRDEEYDFTVPLPYLSLPQVSAFIQVLQSATFRDRVTALGGYTAEHAGEVLTLG